MEYIYIIQQTWDNPYEGTSSCIMSAHKNQQEAETRLKEYYEDDIKWLIEEYDDITKEDFEENILNTNSSFVQYGDYWSSNEIIKTLLQ